MSLVVFSTPAEEKRATSVKAAPLIELLMTKRPVGVAPWTGTVSTANSTGCDADPLVPHPCPARRTAGDLDWVLFTATTGLVWTTSPLPCEIHMRLVMPLTVEPLDTTPEVIKTILPPVPVPVPWLPMTFVSVPFPFEVD